ncbi:MAG: DUF1080 domain-containing protein [Chitinophagales bacterium]|nr:DUF1080 domain-containing protein [Chitinophagales bacterium]
MQSYLSSIGIMLVCFVYSNSLMGQGYQSLSLDDLSSFDATAKNWQLVGGVKADWQKEYDLKTEKGRGVLANSPTEKHRSNIQTKLQHGDIDLELEFMMAAHSNSGIYLQGKYEVQLLDSWGVKHPAFSDCGGVYERWDESREKGEKGYEGIAPLMNACRAPGLWQHLSISFQAARFDDYGNKIKNARLLKVMLNGVLIHDNIELTGPTRGGGKDEVRRGPILFQGDHGPVAFRNIRYRTFDNPPPVLKNLKYEHYVAINDGLSLEGLLLKQSGEVGRLTHEVTSETEKFTLRFKGILEIPQSGRYFFNLNSFGWSSLSIGKDTLFPRVAWDNETSIVLEKGEYPLELRYVKMGNWFVNGLGLFIAGPGVRKRALHMESSLPPSRRLTNPIYLDFENETVIMRSFIDFQGFTDTAIHRITHPISVGFPEKLAFSYNLKNGALFQAWRYAFLDATPMWDSRGDGSAKALGSTLRLEDIPAVAVLNNLQAAWPKNGAENTDFRPKGYRLDKERNPVFLYETAGLKIEDAVKPVEKGKKLNRTLSWDGNAKKGTYFLLGLGNEVEALSGNLYLIDQRYYIALPDKAGFKAEIRKHSNHQELLIPMHGIQQLSYQLIF